MSMTIFPFVMPDATPLSLNSTSPTCGVSGTMTKTMSACCATCLPLLHAVAPAATTSGGTDGTECTNS